MAKTIVYENKAKEKILAGVEKLEKAVSVTLGPCGKNVIIDEFGSIHSTRDGVTVAKSVILKDKLENVGANAIREVAEKSNEKVGDGTTTSTVLAASIYKNGLKHVSLGANATQIKNGIMKASEHAVELIKTGAVKISTKDDIKRVAVVSANGDEKIGEMISDVMDKIGNDGTIKVEDGSGVDLTSKIIEGMVIDRSYESPYMITNAETMEAELENPFILVTDKKITNMQEFLPCLQSVSKTGRPLLIIAESYGDDILATLIMTRMRGNGLVSVAIKAPSYGDNRKDILDDIATLCGGRVVTDSTGTKLENAVPESGILGMAQRIVVSKQNTIIMGGYGTKEAVNARADSIRAQINTIDNKFDKEKLSERLAKLTSGVGVISVGATTDAERKELRDRVDDAFYASKAALRMGVVAGGGSALLKAKAEMTDWISNNFTGDEKIGAKIFCDSMDAPVRKIIDNAGEDSSLIVGKILESNFDNAGYNVITREYVDMIKDGIIDPAEVVINEIKNSASVASLLLQTDAIIIDEPEEKHDCTCGHPQMPMM